MEKKRDALEMNYVLIKKEQRFDDVSGQLSYAL